MNANSHDRPATSEGMQVRFLYPSLGHNQHWTQRISPGEVHHSSAEGQIFGIHGPEFHDELCGDGMSGDQSGLARLSSAQAAEPRLARIVRARVSATGRRPLFQVDPLHRARTARLRAIRSPPRIPSQAAHVSTRRERDSRLWIGARRSFDEAIQLDHQRFWVCRGMGKSPTQK